MSPRLSPLAVLSLLIGGCGGPGQTPDDAQLATPESGAAESAAPALSSVPVTAQAPPPTEAPSNAGDSSSGNIAAGPPSEPDSQNQLQCIQLGGGRQYCFRPTPKPVAPEAWRPPIGPPDSGEGVPEPAPDAPAKPPE
jgi:hypothetical protein